MKTVFKGKNLKTLVELLPIIIFCSLVPLIAYTKYVELSEVVSSGWMGLPHSANVFTYYKMVVILACAALALIILIYKLIKKELRLRFHLVLPAVVIYGVLTILSAILSDHPSVAFFGGPERNEGALVILSYTIMFLYTVHIADTPKKIRILMISIAASSAVVTLIGIMQFYGFDIFRKPFITKLLNMDYTDAYPYEINIVEVANASYGVFSSSNYMGMYLSLIIPSAFAFFALRKSNSGRLAASLLIYACILSLIGTSSGGAYYAFGASMVLLLFFAFPYIKKNVINVVMMSVVVIGLLLVTNIFMDNLIAVRLNIKSLSYELSIGQSEISSIYIDDIILDKTSVFIDTTDKDFSVSNKSGLIEVFARDGSEIPVFTYDEGEENLFPGTIVLFDDPNYKNYVITTNDDYSIFAVKAGVRVMYFHMTDEGIKVPGLDNSLNFIVPVERNEFLYENVRNFHGRGYIWAVTLPMLKETIFLGNGPDTFFLNYPQHDYIGKINMRGSFNVVIAKPHNYYLQLAHDSGLIALFLMLLAFAYYFIDTIICLIKDKRKNEWRVYSVAVLCGVTGYLICGLGFDSNVNVAPVFWTLLAIGVSLNIHSKISRKSNTPKITGK